MPVMVDIITTRQIYVRVFLIPMIWLKVIIEGRDNDGPDKSNARAGPFPIPKSIKALMIGTSVSVAKYITAPNIDAIKLPNKVLPPT